MKKVLIACAALALGGMAYAQDTAPSDSMTPPPSTQAMPSAGADFTGQKIYTSDGDTVGIVDSMTSDVNGQRMAVVSVDRHLGIGSKRVLFPTNALQAREKGGYMTNLNEDQIEQLPKANATNTPTP